MHNIIMFNSIENQLYKIDAKDHIPRNISCTKIESILKRNQSETGGLASTLKIKLNTRFMLTMNVDLQDRLVIGQSGAVKHIAINDQQSISKIYIKFDDNKAGLKRTSMDSLAHDWMGRWVPIERAEASITVRASKDSSPVINRSQFHLMLAWGYTVQKVQELTLEKVVISFNSVKQQSFIMGRLCCFKQSHII